MNPPATRPKRPARSDPVCPYRAHCERARDCERLLLSGGLSYPREMWNAACDHGLDWESFIDVRHRKLFDVLTACVVLGIDPDPWVIAETMKDLHFPFVDDELRTLWWLETTPTGLPVWASQVRFYSDRRQQCRSLWSEAHDCITDIAPDATTMAPTRLEVVA